MYSEKLKRKIREVVTVERVVVAVGSIMVYTYIMDKFGYRMVRPVYSNDTHLVFNHPFGGVSAVRLDK